MVNAGIAEHAVEYSHLPLIELDTRHCPVDYSGEDPQGCRFREPYNIRQLHLAQVKGIHVQYRHCVREIPVRHTLHLVLRARAVIIVAVEIEVAECCARGSVKVRHESEVRTVLPRIVQVDDVREIELREHHERRVVSPPVSGSYLDSCRCRVPPVHDFAGMFYICHCKVRHILYAVLYLLRGVADGRETLAQSYTLLRHCRL